MFRFLFLAAVFLAVPVMAQSPNSACTDFIATLPATWTRTWIDVPFHPNRPEDGMIQVFYYGNWTQYPNQPPLVFFNGGPGGKSWGLFRSWMRAPQAQNRPVVFIDQRGNGCSTPYPNRLPANREQALELRHFGADAIIHDAERIREVIRPAGSKWILFGQSYGSLIVHRYLSLYPKKVIAGFAHGWALLSDPSQYRKLYRLHFLEGARTFFATRPALDSALNALYETQTRSVCSASPCRYGIIPEEWIPLFALEERHEELEQQVADFLARGAVETVVYPIPESQPSLAPMTPTNAATEVIARFDYGNRKYKPEDPYGCMSSMTSLNHEWAGQGSAAFLLKTNSFQCEPRWLVAEPLRRWVVDPKPKDRQLETLKKVLNANPAVTLSLYSGREDPYSPPTYYRDEQRVLGSRLNFRTIDGGHFDYFNAPEFWEDLDRIAARF